MIERIGVILMLAITILAIVVAIAKGNPIKEERPQNRCVKIVDIVKKVVMPDK